MQKKEKHEEADILNSVLQKKRKQKGITAKYYYFIKKRFDVLDNMQLILIQKLFFIGLVLLLLG